MSECAAGGEHEFDEIEEDLWDGDHKMVRPTRCSKCNEVWDVSVYRWDGEYGWNDRGDPECDHDFETVDWHDSAGNDGSPQGREGCTKCSAERSHELHLDETRHEDREGNPV